MGQAFDICIRGAGVVGRAAALLLARAGLRVALVAPPASSGQADVRAYALNAASRSLLESVRAWPEAQHATAVQQMQIWSDTGGAVAFDAVAERVPALAWVVDVPALGQRICPASGISASYLMWAVQSTVVEKLLEKGLKPSVYISNHMPDAARINGEALENYEKYGF